MKKSDEFIKESVFRTNLKFLRLENKTKELFFECLDDGKDEQYFEEKIKELWGSIDYSFMDDEIEEYKKLIHDNNLQLLELEEPKTEEETKKETSFFKKVATIVIISYAVKFVNEKAKEYKSSKNSEAYKADKKEYLKLKVQRYNDKIVPYFVKKTGKVRYVDLNTYVSMIHNTNLTREGWNQTLNDAENFGHNMFYIPFHFFSCPYCMEYQGRPLTRLQIEDFLNLEAEEQEGDILHPNCKCTLQLYTDATEMALASTILKRNRYSLGELEEQYNIRQKMNGLTLKKERLLTDIRIQKELGNQDVVDRLNKKRRALNEKIGELKHELPTEELQKQVVAINR